MTAPERSRQNLAAQYLGKSWRNILLALFALGYGIYFVRLLLPGLKSWFSGDDLLNIHYVWSRPAGDLIRGNILFFNHYSRPMGELLLYLIYLVFGFHAGPFNVVRLALAVVNTVVLYLFAERLTRSREVAVYTVMLAGFHPQLNSVYYDSGMVFDALAFLFFYSGLALYFHYRRNGQLPDSVQNFQVVLLYVAALDSKEIAVSFPVALLLYELTIGSQGQEFSVRGLFRRCRPAFITGLLALIYVVGKNTGADALSTTSAYHPDISLSGYLHNYAHYAGEFLRDSGYPQDAWVGGTLLGCIALGLLLRNRVLIWASLFNVVSVLPIAFIPPRNGFIFLVPLAGWGIYGAALLADLRQRLLRFTPVPRVIGQAAIVVALFFLVLRPEERTLRRILYPLIHVEQDSNLEAWDSMRAIVGANPGSKRILALHDPFKNDFYLLFLAHLGYNDPGVVVDTTRTLAGAGAEPSYQDYDFVIDYNHGRFTRVAAHDLTQLVNRRKCEETQPLTPGSYDETDPRIVFIGPWTRSTSFPETYGKTITYSNARTAQACLSIDGAGFRYVYTKAFNRGIAEILVDGQPQPAVDLYSGTVQWQAKTVISGLAPGHHFVSLNVTGRKNDRATDTYVDLDAVEVF